VITEPALARCLRRHWGLAHVRITAHNGGMGSSTWFVDHESNRWVAKAVAPAAGSQFAAAQRFHWVNPDADYLSLRPWLRPASPQRSTRSTLPILMACRGACCTPTLRPGHSG
jgi:hypothetical protein